MYLSDTQWIETINNLLQFILHMIHCHSKLKILMMRYLRSIADSSGVGNCKCITKSMFSFSSSDFDSECSNNDGKGVAEPPLTNEVNSSQLVLQMFEKILVS